MTRGKPPISYTSRLRQPRFATFIVVAVLLLVALLHQLSSGATTSANVGRQMVAVPSGSPAISRPKATKRKVQLPAWDEEPEAVAVRHVGTGDNEADPTNSNDDSPSPPATQSPPVARLSLNPPKRTIEAADTRLHAITVQTKGSPGWCRMLKTAALSGIRVTNIGWGMEYAHRKRPQWILEWIASQQQQQQQPKEQGQRQLAAVASFDEEEQPLSMKDNGRTAGVARKRSDRALDDWDVLLFADGSDSAFTGFDSSEIVTKFTRLTAGAVDASLLVDEIDGNDAGAGEPGEGNMLRGFDARKRRRPKAPVPLLFNAEANCYHQQLFDGPWGVKKGKCLSAYKKYNPFVMSKWRYLNAGGWIGYVWAVKRFFSVVQGELDKRPSLWCDQSVIGGLMLSRKYDHLVYLDYANKIFLPTYHLETSDFCPTDTDDFGVEGGIDVRNVEKDDPHRGLRLCHSKAQPAVLHFNGKSEGGKSDQILMRTAWYQRAQTEKGKTGAVDLLRRWTTSLFKNTGAVTEQSPFARVCPGFDKVD